MTFAEWVPSEYNTDGYKFGQYNSLAFEVLANADGYVLHDDFNGTYASPTTPVKGVHYVVTSDQISGIT